MRVRRRRRTLSIVRHNLYTWQKSNGSWNPSTAERTFHFCNIITDFKFYPFNPKTIPLLSLQLYNPSFYPHFRFLPHSEIFFFFLKRIQTKNQSMASQGSKNSQGSNNNNKSVAQTNPLSTRTTSFLQHNYHQIHQLQKPNSPPEKTST